MDDLVAASGLSKGSLYWHFDSKEDVFLALFDFMAADVFGRFEAAAEEREADVVALLARELNVFFERFGSSRTLLLAWLEFLAHPRGRERMAEIYRRSRVALAKVVALGIEQGQLRAISPESTAAALTGVIDALLLQAAIDPDFDLQAHVETLWLILQRGVAAPEASG